MTNLAEKLDLALSPSPSIYKKLIRAKAGFGDISKNKVNPHFKSKYADLGQILDAVVPALDKEGLFLSQPFEGDTVYSRIIDADTGESIESGMSIPADLDAQKKCASATYFRRHTLLGLLAIAAEDEDGEATRSSAPAAPRAVPVDNGAVNAATKALNAKPIVPILDVGNEEIKFGKYKTKFVSEAAQDEKFLSWCEWLIESGKGDASKANFVQKALAWREWAITKGGSVEQDSIPF